MILADGLKTKKIRSSQMCEVGGELLNCRVDMPRYAKHSVLQFSSLSVPGIEGLSQQPWLQTQKSTGLF